MALFINNDEVRQLATMADALEAVEAAFKHLGDGDAVNHPRRRLSSPAGGMQVMPAVDAVTGIGGHKTYFGRGGGLCLLFDVKATEILAAIQVARLGQLRTGAASGVATKFMARENSETLGVIGSGYQARTQVEAVCAVRPIKQVRVYSRDSGRRAEFATRTQETLGIDVVPAESGEEAVRGADIVCTATNSSQPVLMGEWLSEGTHVNAVGSNSLLRQEIDDAVSGRAGVIAVDDTAAIDLEGGDLLGALTRGTVTKSKLVDLAYIVSGSMAGRNSDAQITLFKSHGIALEDIAIGEVIYRKAKAQGVGVEIPL